MSSSQPLLEKGVRHRVTIHEDDGTERRGVIVFDSDSASPLVTGSSVAAARSQIENAETRAAVLSMVKFVLAGFTLLILTLPFIVIVGLKWCLFVFSWVPELMEKDCSRL